MRNADISRTMSITDCRSAPWATLRWSDASLTEAACLNEKTSPAGPAAPTGATRRKGDA
ncbi:hypothetical protein SAMN04487982_1207 [Streptomyces sp. ok210]|nr:hypothetical protein SAMN04487982_1207 [Streptomyces sp. ok210]